jgi:predicted nucleic acid-binding protein
MAVVADANLLVALRGGDDRAPAVRQLFAGWIEAGEPIHAPTLALYEIANALTRLVVAGGITLDEVAVAVQTISEQQIELHPLVDIRRMVDIALRLQRQSAYDAAYIALAEDLAAELWTLDGPLARNAASVGFPVRLVSTTS